MTIAIARTDGGVSIMEIYGKTIIATAIEDWKAAHPGAYVSHVEIAAAVIPRDYTFRNAWRLKGKTIEHDMEKARAIQRDRIRAVRDPMLVALDADYDKADEQVDTNGKKAVAARKQALRDAPQDPAINAAQTPDELKAAWPACLDDH